MFCAPGLVFGGTECVGSRFHVLRSRTRFQLYRGRRVPFSCFACPDSFSAVPRASLHVFMFSAPGHVFGGTKGVGSYFHVLRFRTHFRRYRGRPFSFTCFWRYRGRRDTFSYFTLPYSFLVVPGVLGPVFTFCASGLIFGVTGGVGSRFLILHTRTRFQRFRGRWVPFSFFARQYSFSAVPRASGLIIMFCAPELILRGTDYHVLRRVSLSCFASGLIIMFSALGLIFGGTEGVPSHFHVLRVRTHFR
jgi:hypothetical protein